ncbi:MAG: Ig domain-containing protein [candidate division Zixibacteria bacterium]|nr:Ig domain-containing protein [candidate division Zixibacteria bacterium]
MITAIGGQAIGNDFLVPVDDSISKMYSSGVARTRWVDPSGGHPITFQEWSVQTGERGPWRSALVMTASPKTTGRDLVGFGILIDSVLYSQVEESIALYVLDLTGEGYDVKVHAISGGTPADLRSFLYSEYLDGMAGCVFIGDLPVAWYETDFGDPPAHAEFPIDLFYMDLDGSFADLDVDGMYDEHTGNVEPEIYMGRLTASPLTMGGDSEADLLIDYFDRNHQYRSGLLPLNNKALVYIEDDWVSGANWWNTNVGEAYSDREFVKDEWTTFAPDYEGRLANTYSFIQVCVHSWHEGHQFTNPSSEYSYTYNSEIRELQPVSHFYNLFACSNALYVEKDYMSGWYIFGQQYGLAAIGSAKSGSMLAFEDFYRPFGDGKEIGQAYLEWFVDRSAGGFEEWEITWFYGMTLNGDPTLAIQKKSTSFLAQYDNGSASYMVHADDYYNVRFTAAKTCTLTTIAIDGYFPGSPAARIYVWNSDGVYPTTVIDSIDLPSGTLPSVGTITVDVSDRNLMFYEAAEFHIGINHLNPGSEDTLWVYMDNAVPSGVNRSGGFSGGVWKTNSELLGADYNYLIRVQANAVPDPQVEILTLMVPDGTIGQPYSTTLEAAGGTPPYTWSVNAGSLPNGMEVDLISGILSGVSTISGTFNFTVQAVDGNCPGTVDIQHLSVVITQACGDIDANGEEPNIADLTYLVAYLFTGGPPPPVMEKANVDGVIGPGGIINISDLTYLVAYLFTGGPAPVCGS